MSAETCGTYSNPAPARPGESQSLAKSGFIWSRVEFFENGNSSVYAYRRFRFKSTSRRSSNIRPCLQQCGILNGRCDVLKIPRTHRILGPHGGNVDVVTCIGLHHLVHERQSLTAAGHIETRCANCTRCSRPGAVGACRDSDFSVHCTSSCCVVAWITATISPGRSGGLDRSHLAII